jgi:hypothetical protein
VKRIGFVLTFVLLVFSLISCRGESPTLPPPPPPPQPRYTLNLVPENYAATLSSGAGRTSFGIFVSPKITTNDFNITLETRNGRVLGTIEAPYNNIVTDRYTIIVLAEVFPGFSIKAKLMKGATLIVENSWNFPVKEIPRCRWRKTIPTTVFYNYDTTVTPEVKRAAEWGMNFWRTLMDINWIFDTTGSGRPLFIFKKVEGFGSAECYFHPPQPSLDRDICYLNINADEHTAAHEIGHGLGLWHSPAEEGPYALMRGETYVEGCISDMSPVEYFQFFVHPSRLAP